MRGPLPETKARASGALREEVRHFSTGSNYLRQGGLRLDCQNYSEQSFWAGLVAKDCGYETATLGELAPMTFTPPRFKRLYVDYDNGYPYLSASELVLATPPQVRFASQTTPNFQQYLVRQGWILVTDSGTVGRTVLVGRTLSKFFVTNNAVRVIAEGESIAGYIYAYLSSWLGQALLAKDKYGAVIKHIESFHVTQIPVPLLPPPLQRRIHTDILEAYRLRDEANDLLDQADQLLYSELGLPRLDTSQVRYYGGGDVKVFQTRRHKLNLRLDARYSTPIVQLLENNLADGAKSGHFTTSTIEGVTEDILLPTRFGRTYVQEKHGIPFYQSTHVVQFKPFDINFISRTTTRNLEEYIVDRGWTLLTRSGTLGRTGFVGSAMAGCAVSEHVIRVIPDNKQIQPGFLYAFLSSDYGYWLTVRNRYGAVVDEIAPQHLRTIPVPAAPPGIQEAADSLVVTAFENRDKANWLEDQAIKLLEDTLVESYQRRTGRKVAIA